MARSILALFSGSHSRSLASYSRLGAGQEPGTQDRRPWPFKWVVSASPSLAGNNLNSQNRQ